MGVKKGDHIAFVLPNCPEFLFALFAVTKIGAVFIPLNPQSTAEEAEYVLNHSEATIVLTSSWIYCPWSSPSARSSPALKQGTLVTATGEFAGALAWDKFLAGVADTGGR